MVELSDVQVPFSVPIRDGLPDGGEVTINGDVIVGNEKAIWIEFKKGEDIALHLHIRFGYLNGRNEIVVNSCQGGSWGHEEVHQQTVIVGGALHTTIGISGHSYKIVVNSNSFKFKQRIPKENVTEFVITGDLKINKINFDNFAGHVDKSPDPVAPNNEPSYPSPPNYPPNYPPQPPYNPGYPDLPLQPEIGSQGPPLNPQPFSPNTQFNQGGHSIGQGAQLGGFNNQGVGFGNAQFQNSPDPRGY